MLRKALSIILKATDIIALCFLIPLFIASLFVFRSVDFETFREVTSEIRENPFINLFFLLILLAVILIITELSQAIKNGAGSRSSYLVIAFCALLILIAGHLWIRSNPFEPVADQAQVWTAANEIAAGNGAEHTDLRYFNVYPQQKPMAVFMAFFIKLLGEGVSVYAHLNLVFMTAAIVFAALCVKEQTENARTVTAVTLLLTTFAPLIMYSTFMYGSVAAIFFSILSAYGLIRYFKTGAPGWLICPVICVPAAVLMYQSALIYLIATVIILIFGAFYLKDGVRNRILCLLTALIMVAFTMLSTSAAETAFDRSLGYTEEGGKGIPPFGHMLMGLQDVDGNMPGNYNGASLRLYEETGFDSEETSRQAAQKIKEIFGEFTSGERSPSFFLVKTECQWLDPWFGGLTMNVYDAEYSDAYENEEWDLFLKGPTLPGLQRYLRILMILLYAGAIFNIGARLVRKDDVPVIAYLPSIYFIGGFVFQFFWEQKSRYCLPYFVALFPLAACGITGLEDFCGKKLENWTLRKKVCVITGIIGSLILLMIAASGNEKDFKPGIHADGDTNVLLTRDLQLPKGDYGLTLYYVSETDSDITLCLDDSGVTYPVHLPAAENSVDIPAYMDSYKDSVHFIIIPETAATLNIENIHVYCTKVLYHDLFYVTALFICMMVFIYIVYEPGPFSRRPLSERKLIKTLTVGAILTIPAAYGLSFFFHVPLLCRFLRMSAPFSVFAVIFVIYVLAAAAIYMISTKRSASGRTPAGSKV